MVICLERDADLHMAQLMPLPLTVSCFSKILISFTFLVLAHPGSPGKRAVKLVCVCVCVARLFSFLRVHIIMLQVTQMSLKDSRIKMMNEVLNGIEVIVSICVMFL